MPDADTVWLTPLDELRALLERAGLTVRWQEDHSASHRATVGRADRGVLRRCDGDRGRHRAPAPWTT